MGLAQEVGLAANVLVEGLKSYILVRLQLSIDLAEGKQLAELRIRACIFCRFRSVELLTLLERDERILLSEDVRVFEKDRRDHVDFENADLGHDGWQGIDLLKDILRYDFDAADVLVI